MNILVISAFSRKLKTFTASATMLESGAIVLRKAVELDSVEDIVGYKKFNSPILILGEYQASSSAGFTKIKYAHNNELIEKVSIVGGVGFGYHKTDADGNIKKVGYGLRVFKNPMEGTLIPAGAEIDFVNTNYNSNPETTSASRFGLDLIAESNPRVVILEEGQSDYVDAILFKIPKQIEKIEMPLEHSDFFSLEKFMDRYMSNCPVRVAIAYAVLSVCDETNFQNEHSDLLPNSFIFKFFKYDDVKEFIEKKYNELLDHGWKFYLGKQARPMADSPDGETVSPVPRLGLFFDQCRKVCEYFLRVVDNKTTLESKRNIYLSKLRSKIFYEFWDKFNLKYIKSYYNFLVTYKLENQEEIKLWFADEGEGPNKESPVSGNCFRHWDEKDISRLEYIKMKAYKKDSGEYEDEKVFTVTDCKDVYVKNMRHIH